MPPLWGSINVLTMYYPGLAPWAMQEYRPKGLFYDTFKINVSTSYSLLYLRALTFVSTSYLFWYLRTPKFSTQLKSVQTSAVVCTNFSCSLYRLRRGFENRKCNSYFFLVYLDIFMKPLACLFMYRKAIDDGADYVPSPRIHLGLSTRL